ncbi:MAG TPA: nitroreductase family protein [Candidatus Deferrimicrobium sp.]|nr:nitroreductase family protein [Candidatus Deferrimicrobium sp.]
MSEAMPVVINREKCITCFECAWICPTSTLYKKGETLQVAKDAAVRCIRCAHCLAVCPEDAVTITCYTDETEIAPIPDIRLDPETILNFMRSRRSTRLFKPDPLERSDLDLLINAARYAPSGHNDQTSAFTVITGKRVKEIKATLIQEIAPVLKALPEDPVAAAERLTKFLPKTSTAMISSMLGLMKELVQVMETGGRDCLFWDAPVLIIISAKKESSGFPAALENACLSAAYLMLMAEAMDLGTCSMGILIYSLGMSRKVRKLLELPKDNRALYALAIGKKATHFRKFVPRNKPKINYVN